MLQDRVMAHIRVNVASLEVSTPAGQSSTDAGVIRDQQADVLSYWNEAQKRLPTVSAVARKFLGVTATFVAAKRVFSKTRYVVSDRRALLKPSKMQQLTFLNCNWDSIRFELCSCIAVRWQTDLLID